MDDTASDRNGINSEEVNLHNDTKQPHKPSAKSTTRNGPKILPPGCSLEQFNKFLDASRNVVTPENVDLIELSHELQDGDYMHPCKGHDMHAILDREYFVASATISPRDVPEVQAMMKLCNEFEIPVWPFSIGRNTGLVELRLGFREACVWIWGGI